MIIEGMLLGIFGNGIYDIIKGAFKDFIIDKDNDLINRIYDAIEEASKSFFAKYKNEFGEPSSSFLARQDNIEIIVKSINYGNNIELVNELDTKGFDGVKPVTSEALLYFVNKLNDLMLKDFKLNKIIIEKKHMVENYETSKKIIDMLSTLVQQENPTEDKIDDSFKGWTMRDQQGKKSALIEGKQYIQSFPNGTKINFMLKNGLIYVDFVDAHDKKSYYELDINGNVKDSKFPYEISEYILNIPNEQVVHKNVISLPNGLRREVIKLKWDKQADVMYDKDGKLMQINLHGGWEVNHSKRIIHPIK